MVTLDKQETPNHDMNPLRNLLLAAFLLPICSAMAQTSAGNEQEKIKIVIAPTEKNANRAAVFINNKFQHYGSVNPNAIDSLHVKKGELNINGQNYNGRLQIRTKKGYLPNLSTLDRLRAKYTSLPKGSLLFMIDGKMIQEDYSVYTVDENYIMTLVIDKVANRNENIFFNLIRLFTRSPENIKKSQLVIRGGEGPSSSQF
ncbi:hypothetical protein [uncultured Pedobacter sp.]|uniref:hypothetical protein n=1 Tax=uncultured Pedobacter sp. TaxID=246139 RepID=UPI002601F671|nr:hypothetical protein [uncultured Pedobacter sp.]